MKGKRKGIVVLLLVAALVLVSGVAAFAHRWDLDSAEEVKKLDGTLSFSRAWGFTLTASSGERYRLLMHPMRFLDETQLNVGANDRVSVSGYKVDDDVIFVSTMTKGSKAYEIADPEKLREYGPGPYAGNRPGGRRVPGGEYEGRGWDEDYGMHGGARCW